MKKLISLLAALILNCGSSVGQVGPKINAVVNSADFGSTIASGGLVTMFGSGFSDGEYSATLPLPKQLGSTRVMTCSDPAIFIERCTPLDLIYVGPTQINFVAPTITTSFTFGRYLFVQRDGEPSTSSKAIAAATTFNLYRSWPSIFTIGYDCNIDPRYPKDSPCKLTHDRQAADQKIRGAITDQHGNLITSTNPARVGGVYTIWLTGLGPISNGKPVDAVDITLGEIPVYAYSGPTWTPVAPLWAGRSPEFPGLDQINFRVPDDLMGATRTGYPPMHPCGDYKIELKLTVKRDPVHLPVVVNRGDVPCW